MVGQLVGPKMFLDTRINPVARGRSRSARSNLIQKLIHPILFLGRWLFSQVRFQFLGQKLGDSFPRPDTAHQSLELDDSEQAAVQVERCGIFLVVSLHPIPLHKSRLLLQLVLRRVRPHVFMFATSSPGLDVRTVFKFSVLSLLRWTARLKAVVFVR